MARKFLIQVQVVVHNKKGLEELKERMEQLFFPEHFPKTIKEFNKIVKPLETHEIIIGEI